MKFTPRRWFDRILALRLALMSGAMLATLLALGFATRAEAQPAALADPPGRVARLSDVGGQVWLYSPDTGDWVNATRNRPLTKFKAR